MYAIVCVSEENFAREKCFEKSTVIDGCICLIGCSRNYSAERRFTPDADQSGSAGIACALPGSHIHTWQKEAFKPRV